MPFFYQVRIVVVFFLCFFFGFYNNSFSQSLDCPLPPHGTYINDGLYVIADGGCYLTAEEAKAACLASHITYLQYCENNRTNTIVVDSTGESIDLPYLGNTIADWPKPRDIGFFYPQTINCPEGGGPLDVCLVEENVIVDFRDECDFRCKCPDYAGEGDYDFENCPNRECDLTAATQDAIAECGTSENVFWNDVEKCDWECKPQECEAEYLAAKQECKTPFLLDRLTCEYICECEENRRTAEEHCTAGFYFDRDTCEWDCKCCGDKFRECSQYCGGDKNVKPFSCADSTSIASSCIVDVSKLSPCECIVPPIESKEPDPEEKPEPPSCADFEAACSASGCKPSCISDPDTGFILSRNCDCGEDPTDPGPDGEIGTPDDEEKDDFANGWLKSIEENTDRTANAVKESGEKTNAWLEAIKHDIDNSLENDQKYFLDSSGKPYLKTISEKLDDLDIQTTGSGGGLTTNTYDEVVEDVLDDDFSKMLSDYVATGIPLISYLEGSTINLSSVSSSLTMTFWGNQVVVDFAQYTGVVDLAGNLLLGLTVFSGLMLIITRVKG